MEHRKDSKKELESR